MENYDNNDQLNVPRLAALINNSKGIQHNFYSRAQIILDKRSKNKHSYGYAESIKNIHPNAETAETRYDPANTHYVPVLLSPRKQSLSQLLNKNSKQRTSSPKHKITPDKTKSHQQHDFVEINLTGHKP